MRRLYIIGLLLSVLGFSGCFEDKGNYSYTDYLEIQIDSVKQYYDCQALVDTLHIEPQVSLADEKCEYTWSVYQIEVTGFNPPLDTIGHSRVLHYPVALVPGKYILLFTAKEKESGIVQIVQSALAVGTPFSTGWYVLRSRDGYMDMDLFTESGKAENIIAQNNEGKRLAGDAVSVGFSTKYQIWNEGKKKYEDVVAFLVASSKSLAAIQVNNGKIINQDEEMFYEMPSSLTPNNTFCGTRDIYLINEGKVYYINGMANNSGQFANALPGDYRLSPYEVLYRYNAMAYDEVSCSFCGVSANSLSIIRLFDEGTVDTISLPPVNNLDANLLYMGSGSNSTVWALMKKKQEELYVMRNMNGNSRNQYNPTKRCDTLDNKLKIVHANAWASNRNNNIIYFARQDTIYSCNLDANYQEKSQAVLGVGESVTYMCHLSLTDYSYLEKSFNHIVVASYNGKSYKVHLFNIQAGNLQPNPRVFEGEGKVGAIIYVNGNSSTGLL